MRQFGSNGCYVNYFQYVCVRPSMYVWNFTDRYVFIWIIQAFTVRNQLFGIDSERAFSLQNWFQPIFENCRKYFCMKKKIYDFNKQSRYFEVINLLLLRMIHKLWLTCFLPEICFYLILSESETTTSVSLNFRISLGNKINICFYIPTRISILMVTFTVMSHFAFEFLF